MKSVVIGGTAGVGREIAISLASQGHSLLITGKDVLDVEACTADLQIRYGVDAFGLAVQASDHKSFVHALESAATTFGTINYLFLPIGASIEKDNGSLKIVDLNEIFSSNLASIVMAVQVFESQFVKTGNASIVGFSSIAAIRGRGENVFYAASKRAVESYFESLKIMYYDRNITVKFYRIGYLDTYQSYGKRLLFPKKDPRNAANQIVENLTQTKLMSYYPGYWRWIAILVRVVPTSLYRKMTS